MTAQPASGLQDGDRLARAGHLTQAAAAYTRLIEAGVQTEPALTRRGRICRDMFRYHQAEADFRRALAINPAAEDALKHLGFMLRETKRIEEAIAVFSKLLSLGAPANRAVARAELGELLRSAWRFAAAGSMVAPLVSSGQVSLAGRYTKAQHDAASERAFAKECIVALRANPDSDEDLLKGAEHLLKAGWPKLALRLVGKIGDREGHARRMLAVHFFAAWQAHSASAGLDVLKAYAASIPANDRHYAYCMALALLQNGSPDDAVATLRAVQERHRDDAYFDLLWRAFAASNAPPEDALALFGSLDSAEPSVKSARTYLSAIAVAGRLPVAFEAGVVYQRGPAAPVRPRTIVQFWDTAPPGEIRALTDEWASRNGLWQHILFSEELARSFIQTHFGNDFAGLFAACHHPAMKADFFRLCYLYVSGGVYIDADERCEMEAAAFFAGWEDAPFVASISNELPFYVHNWLLCALPGHPILKIAIELMTAAVAHARESGTRPHIWHTTGPGCVTRAVAMHIRSGEAASGRVPDDLVLISQGHFRRFAKTPGLEYKKQQSGNWRLAR